MSTKTAQAFPKLNKLVAIQWSTQSLDLRGDIRWPITKRETEKMVPLTSTKRGELQRRPDNASPGMKLIWWRPWTPGHADICCRPKCCFTAVSVACDVSTATVRVYSKMDSGAKRRRHVASDSAEGTSEPLRLG